MWKKIILILLFFCLATPTIGNSALLYSNGEIWNSFKKTEKEAYLYGLFDGMTVGRQLIAMRLESPICRDSADFAYVLSYQKFISPPSNDQLLKELDKFYAFKANLSIRISDAFTIIIHKIYGIPDAILAEMLEDARKTMNASEDAQKAGETKLPIEK